MKVLIGVDGSSNSFAAVEFVGRLLSAERDELVLLFATPEMTFEDERLDPAIEQRARSALSRTVLEAALERLPAAWQQRAQQRQVTGSASAALLDAIDAEKADLVAVGFRGTSGILEDFVLGSVSRAIVHSAKIPALVVKSEGKTEEPAKQSPGPLDAAHARAGDVRSAAVLPSRPADLLKQFTWPPETVGWVMTVVQPMFVTQLPDWVKRQRDPDVAAMADAWEAGTSAELAGGSRRAGEVSRGSADLLRRARSSSLPRAGRPRRFSRRFANERLIWPCWGAAAEAR